MKFKEPMSDILGSRIKVDILRYFVNHHVRLSGRECAKRVGYSPPSVIAALNGLAASGIVFKEKLGNSFIYSLNDEHILIESIKLLFKAEKDAVDKVVERFAEELEGQLANVIIFGSLARGEDTASSDIDMIISFKKGVDPGRYRDQVVEASNASFAASGNPVDYFLVKQPELEERMEGKDQRGMWKDIFGREPVILYQPKGKGKKLERSYFARGELMRFRLGKNNEEEGAGV